MKHDYETMKNKEALDNFNYADANNLRMDDLGERTKATIRQALTQPAQGWQDISTAPKNKRILVRTKNEVYCAHWAKNPFTDDEAWIVAEWGNEGDQVIVKPIEWHPLPNDTE